MSKVFTRLLLVVYVASALVLSCNQKPNNPIVTAITGINPLDTNAADVDFFPVTNYIKGQVYEIKNSHINPLMITNDGFKKDSVWIKMEEVDQAIATFLDPLIDSTNLKAEFKQTSFKDATLNKITFAYTPTIMHPVGSPLKSWNVYIDPQTNEVSSIYILKITSGKGTEHLNWIAGKKCTIQLLKDDMMVYQRSIIWNFDKND